MKFLTPEHIIRIHRKVEQEQTHMLNENSLYALSAKFFQGYYDESTVLDIAIAYFEDIIKKHIFANGNKRTAFICSLMILEMNGFRTEAPKDVPIFESILSYFKNKDSSHFRSILCDISAERTFPNPSSEEFHYHLDRILEKFEDVIEQLRHT